MGHLFQRIRSADVNRLHAIMESFLFLYYSFLKIMPLPLTINFCLMGYILIIARCYSFTSQNMNDHFIPKMPGILHWQEM